LLLCLFIIIFSLFMVRNLSLRLVSHLKDGCFFIRIKISMLTFGMDLHLRLFREVSLRVREGLVFIGFRVGLVV
jgi:hypothetical protein